MNKEDFLKSGLLEQYLLNLTDPEETEKVEQMLRLYPEIQRELDSMHKAIEKYALSHAIPPPRSKDQDTLKMDGAPSTVGRRLHWRRVGGTIAVLVCSLLCVMLYVQNQGLDQDYRTLRADLLAQRTACEEQLRQAQNRPFAFLSAPGTRTVILKGTPLTPDAEAVVYWNPVQKTACLNVLNLPEPPPGKQYQIWADVAGEMIDMGLIQPTKETIQAIHFIASAESFNITLEPIGGSEHPTVALLHANGLLF